METADLICWSEFEFLKIHHKNVKKLSSILAKEINLTPNQITDIGYAAKHHDIGKLLISQSILNKAGRLSKKEYEIIKKHPYFSYNILKNNGVKKSICEMVKHHHENWDGTGYPDGIKGQEINIGAKIIKICDVYDALVSERPYRKALTHHEAIEIMEKSKNEFDPNLYEVFKRIILKGAKI